MLSIENTKVFKSKRFTKPVTLKVVAPYVGKIAALISRLYSLPNHPRVAAMSK
jgi:hypothetical protein